MSKIVSVDSEHTESSHRVSFNLDSAPLPGVVDRIEYGTLSIWWDGFMLHVKAPEGGPEITAVTVAQLQEKLDEGAENYLLEMNRRDARLKRIAGNLGLPLN